MLCRGGVAVGVGRRRARSLLLPNARSTPTIHTVCCRSSPFPRSDPGLVSLFGPPAGMEEEAWQGGTSDCTAGELAQLMYWLMITGFSLRQLEQRCDLTRTLDLPGPGEEPPGLPPGRWQ